MEEQRVSGVIILEPKAHLPGLLEEVEPEWDSVRLSCLQPLEAEKEWVWELQASSSLPDGP